MMKHWLNMIIAFEIFLLFSVCSAQTAPVTKNVIGPSPNSAVFDKFGNVPVGTYTGVPDINVPIYTIVNKSIKVPISLMYHAGGIQVDEEAGRVGLGWALNCGGVINRQVNGIDDFYPKYGYINNNAPEIINTDITEEIKSAMNVTGNNGSRGSGDCKRTIGNQLTDLNGYLFTTDLDPNQEEMVYDLEPDVFSYNFQGYCGKFIIRKNRQIVQQTPSPLRIQLLDSSGSAFQIITPDGIEYVFGKTEQCNLSVAPVNLTYVTSWYLTKIIATTSEEIDFNYTTDNAISVTPFFNLSEKMILTSYSDDLGVNSCYKNPDAPGMPTSAPIKILPPINTYSSVLLSSVSYPYGEVSFDYSSDRIDLNGDKKLIKINIVNLADHSFNNSFSMVQDYFTANDGTPRFNDINDATFQNYNCKRLKLTGILQQDASGDTAQNYQFTYNEQLLPTKNSYARDLWGFYNGAMNSTLLPSLYYTVPYNNTTLIKSIAGADRAANTINSQAFVLQQITYPTGGKRRYDFEANDYDVTNSINTASPVNHPELLGETKSFITERGLDATFNLSITALDPTTPVTLTTISQGGAPIPASLPQLQDAYISIYAQGSSVPLYQIPLNTPYAFVANGSNNYQRTDALTLPVGNYTVTTHIANNVVFLQYLSFTFGWVYYKNTSNHTIEFGGGLRIARITDIDPISDQETVHKFIYNYNRDYDGDGTAESCSYGRRLASLGYTNNEYVPVVYSCNSGAAVFSAVIDFNLNSDSHIKLLNPVVGYDKVTVLNGENGENGKTECLYENQPDYELSYDFNPTYSNSAGTSIGNMRPSGIPNLIDLQNGQLQQQSDFKYSSATSSFTIVRQIANVYRPTLYSSFQPTSTAIGIRRLALEAGGVTRGSDCGWLLAQYPAFQSNWAPLLSQTTSEYDTYGQLLLQKTTSYGYETDPLHYQPTKVTSDRSDGRYNVVYYTYPSDYASGTSFIDSMSKRNIIAPIEKVTAIMDGTTSPIITAGTITTYRPEQPSLPASIFSLQISSPVALGSFKFSNGSTGNLPVNSLKVLFGQDGKYAPIINFISYDIYGNLTQQQKANDVNHIYLYGYNHTLPVADIIGVDLITVSRYVTQSVIDNPTDDATLRAALNNLRINIPKAMVTTYTYMPLIGISSKTDPAGRTTYYEHDGLGRLNLVRDNERNILKRYCYSYANQVGACPNSPIPTLSCNTTSCSSQVGYKCVNGNCELGTKVNTLSTPFNPFFILLTNLIFIKRWICTYHYQWSDGTVSQDYQEVGQYPCNTLNP